MRSILLYFGSFNPIHVGHVGLAEWVLENRTDIEELWLVVSPQNPFKQDKFLYPDADRLEWARRAVKNNPKITTAILTQNTGLPSHTVEQIVKKLKDINIIIRIEEGINSHWEIIEHNN